MYRVFFVAILISAVGCSSTSSVCSPGEEQDCTCPESESGATSTQVCLADGSAFAECSCETACDETSCDDADPCTTDSCDPLTQECAHEELTCDDNNPCTTDSCGPEGCATEPIEGCCLTNTDCSAGEICTTNSCIQENLACDTASAPLPEGLTELSWDDGNGVTNMENESFELTGLGIPLNDTPLWEAVRFEVDHPGKIHGFSIQYGALPDGGDTAVKAGLYPDFGYNGFDFWKYEAIWEGARCRKDIQEGQWITFVFEEPVTVTVPGLFFVGHLRQGLGDPAWSFDVSTTNEDNSCGGFDDCHSSFNVDTLNTWDENYAYNGLSAPFQYDYMVRLHVEYDEEASDDEMLFEMVEDLTIGSRMAWGDYDNDGDDDLLVGGPTLLRNDDGVLVNGTADALLDAIGVSGAGVWGDYDNDGCLDLFLFNESGSEGDYLVHNNCDGTFSNVTEAAGITDAQDYNDCAGAGWFTSPTPAAAWWDFDADGYLDLYLANFNCWTDYSFYVDTVWKNNGDGTFTEWTGQGGLRGYGESNSPSRGANPIDYDQDGDIDILVNNYVLKPNLFYLNKGDGTFYKSENFTGLSGHGTNWNNQLRFGHTIGTSWGDINNDGLFDVIQSNLAHPRFFDFSAKTQVMIAQGDGKLVDNQGDWSAPLKDTGLYGDAGLRFSETHSIPVLGDFNQDGNLDLVISATYDGRPTDFYWGKGDGTFTLDSYRSGITMTNGWGMAISDMDNDGDLDLATSQGMYMNKGGDDHGNYLQVRVVGNVSSNRSALGATVTITSMDESRVRYVPGGTGQGDQDSLYLHFGLGAWESLDTIHVMFPGGKTVEYPGPHSVNQRIWLYEDGTQGSGWTPPM